MGLRAYNVGADTEWYIFYLEKNKNIEFDQIFVNKEYYEYGYSLFNNICAYINLDKTVFLFIVSAIEVIPFFVFVSKYSQNLLISAISFLAFQPFSLCMGMFRQAMAISIFFVGINSIFEKKLKKYCIFVIIAGFFHTSIFFLIPLYWLNKIRVSKKMIIAVPIVTFVFYVFSNSISHFIVSKSQYDSYLDSKYDMVENGTQLLTILFVIISVICIFSIRNNSNTNKSEIHDEVMNLSIWGCIILCVCQPLVYSFVLFNRITAALSYFLPVCISNIINVAIKKEGEYYISLALYILLIIFCMRQIGSNIYINDYLFFWE